MPASLYDLIHKSEVRPLCRSADKRSNKYWLEEGPMLIKALRFQAEENAKKQGAKGELVHITIEYKGKNEPYTVTYYIKEGDKKLKFTDIIK